MSRTSARAGVARIGRRRRRVRWRLPRLRPAPGLRIAPDRGSFA